MLVLVGLSTLPVGAVNVNNFTITDFEIKLELGRDGEQRSTLQTTETITAEFPNFDQNRGIERAIPKEYDGHSTSLEITSVKKADGSDWSYTTYDDDLGNTIVRIGDADVYVRGMQTYIISYTQRDVTRYFEDTKKQEFYWDTNGTGWLVPIERLSVELMVDPSLSSELTGDTACYQGVTGSGARCELTAEGGTFATEAQQLTAGENVTIAVGFAPETFAEYVPTLFEKIIGYWAVLQSLVTPIAVGLVAWIVVRYFRVTNRTKELATIVPEYIAPTGTSVTAAAKIAKSTKGSVMAAQLIDLAVRHYITLSETSQKGLFGTSKLYHIEIKKSLSNLMAEEQELLSDMFGHLPEVGESLDLKTLKNNTAYYQRTTDNDTKLKTLIDTYGFRAHDAVLTSWLRKAALIILIASVILFAPALLIAATIAFSMSFQVRTLTDKGLELRRYMEGLKMYIEVAEADRLAMLQSPEGAEKATTLGVDATDEKQRVVLYERVLPYAVLFGQEKEWTKQLGAYYEQTGEQPGWYRGSTAFNAAAFSSSVNGFTSATTSYGGSTSSSSGGSSGGGSSGGGGGGGGGGGW